MVGKEFIVAGKAIFTVSSLVTGNRYTYKIVRGKETDKYPNPAYFVYFLTGPSNETDYTYLGVLDPNNGFTRLTKASKCTEDSAPVKAIRWILVRMWQNQDISQCEIRHEGNCGRCGRRLTVPESIDIGLGPECAGKVWN